ncbi:MAG: asparagine--tRNA ligase, partial [Desulfovibrio sp.]
SGQLALEALAMGLGRVYSFGPTFRAENSNTPRHAAEFWMVEPEAAFIGLDDLMDLGEGLVRHVVRHVLDRCQEDIGLFDKFVDKGLAARLENMLKLPFARIPYAEAVHILEDSGREFTYPASFGIDLQTEHERFLSEEHFQRPVIVYDYPREIKAFYMRGNEDDETVAAMDVLVPRIGELIGGSVREERLPRLQARMEELGQKLDDYWWYMDLRRFGTVPHGGFGLGFERLLMMLTGITNIRDVLPFPRTPGSLEF